MNIDSKIQQIISLAKNGLFHEMEKECRHILKKKPNHFDALQFLGLAFSKQGKMGEAIVFLKKALSKNNTHAGAYNNLGYTYTEMGRHKEALINLKKSIKLDPLQAETYNNLGLALFRTKAYRDSLNAYKHAIRLNPQFAQAIDNLGLCLRKMGLLHEAIEQHLKANNLDPFLACVYAHLLQALTLSHITDDAIHVAQAGLEIATTPSPERLDLLIGVALIAWLSGQHELAQEAITQSSFITSDTLANSTNITTQKAFHRYLGKLLLIRSEQPHLYTSKTEQALFFVGESHCLSPSETVVQYQGQEFRVLSSFIQGCKAWHLGRSEENEYKKSLKILLKALPPKSKIVVGMGEIDCRAHEGILRAHLTKGIDFHSSTVELVEKYVDFTSVAARQYKHSLIFYGVPSPHHQVTDSLSSEKAFLYQKIIRLFNRQLQLSCNTRGWEMLDVYGLTTGPNHDADNQFHIDGYHLHPRTLGVLFQSHLIAPKR